VHYGKRQRRMARHWDVGAILPMLGQKRLREVGYEDVQRWLTADDHPDPDGDKAPWSQKQASCEAPKSTDVRQRVSGIFTHAEKVQWWSGYPAKHVAIGEMVRRKDRTHSLIQAQALLIASEEPGPQLWCCVRSSRA